MLLAAMYYRSARGGGAALRVDEIRGALLSARIKNARRMNVSDVLAKSGALVNIDGSVGGRRAWKLTKTGERHVRDILGIADETPALRAEISDLATATSDIRDVEVAAYVAEATACFQAGALRATVVFLWSGAIRMIQRKVLKTGVVLLNKALAKHDQRARPVKSIDDFAFVKDRTLLQVALDLQVIDKSERDTLIEDLGLRNRCGHPGKYRPGSGKVSGFVEDLVFCQINRFI